MYSIYATVGGHRVCIYDDTVSNSALKLIDPVLTLSDSAAGSLKFKMAPNNIGYDEYTIETDIAESVSDDGEVTTGTVTETVDLVERMRSTITVYLNNEELWEGRVLSEDRDFDNIRNIYCEGELAYLNDTCQPQRRYTLSGENRMRMLLNLIFNLHNNRVDDSKKFYVGAVTVEPDDLSEYTTEFQKTLEVVNNLVSEYGGHLRIRKENGRRYIDYLEDYPNTSSQQIKFGSNLLDFTCTWDMSDLCTVVLPTGHVVLEGSSSAIGEDLEGTSTHSHSLLRVNSTSSTIDMITTSSLTNYSVVDYTVTPGNNYYVSCRLHGGYVAYEFRNNVDGTIEYETAGRENDIGFTDYIDKKVTAPAAATILRVCGYKNDIPITVKDETEETTGFDQYLTVSDVSTDMDSDGNTWHTQGSMFISNPETVSKYGWIEKQLSLSDIEDADALYTAAKTYLKDGQFDNLTIEINAIDLSIMGVNVDAIRLLDNVRVISEPHGLNRLFPVTKLEIPINKLSEQKFTIGTATEQTLTNVNNDVNEELFNQIMNIPDATLDLAKQNAAALINTATNGFITFVNDPTTGKPKELLITDEEDYTQARKVWRWNINGLGYSNQGYNPSSFVTAMTMNGAIVADFITAGHMSANHIQGGVLTVGGANNTNGRIEVKNSSGNTICELNNAGASITGSVYTEGSFDSGNTTGWLELSAGELSGGIKDGSTLNTYTTLDAATTIRDTVYGTTHGLRIYAEGVSFENCKRIGIKNNHGSEYICYTGTLYIPKPVTISLQTSTVENVVIQDPDSGTISTTNITFVSGVNLSYTTADSNNSETRHVEAGFITT